MTTSEIKSLPPSPKNKRLPWLFAAISFLGFIDAGYLTANYYYRVPLACTVLQGCEQVTTSQYAVVYGIPVALAGALYYLFLFLLSIYVIDRQRVSVLRFLSRLTVFGFLASLWLTYVQFYLLEAWCQYCILSAITSTLLFVLGIYTLRRTRVML